MNRPTRIAALILAAALLGACATTDTRRSLSSGAVGCPSERIAISDERTYMGGANWTASCNGKRFYCTAIAGQAGAQVQCSPEVK